MQLSLGNQFKRQGSVDAATHAHTVNSPKCHAHLPSPSDHQLSGSHFKGQGSVHAAAHTHPIAATTTASSPLDLQLLCLSTPRSRDRNRVSLPKLPLEQALGQSGFKFSLHCPLDRPSPKHWVEALCLQVQQVCQSAVCSCVGQKLERYKQPRLWWSLFACRPNNCIRAAGSRVGLHWTDQQGHTALMGFAGHTKNGQELRAVAMLCTAAASTSLMQTPHKEVCTGGPHDQQT